VRIRSGDIRDQSQKLSEIAKNFGRFFALANFWGRAFQKLYPVYQSCLAARQLKKSFVAIFPVARKLLRVTR